MFSIEKSETKKKDLCPNGRDKTFLIKNWEVRANSLKVKTKQYLEILFFQYHKQNRTSVCSAKENTVCLL